MEVEEKTSTPTFNEAAKIWDICDSYACESYHTGWTWEEAVKYIQDHWNDEEFNINYEHVIEEGSVVLNTNNKL